MINQTKWRTNNLRKDSPFLNQDDQFKWFLLDDMAKYANSHFNQYVQERDLKESILTENHVTSNITEVKKLDEFMSHLLREKNQTSICTFDITLEKISRKILMSWELIPSKVLLLLQMMRLI